MSKTVFLKAGDTPENVVARHFSAYSSTEKSRLRKEVADLLQHGSLIAAQGGSFKSKRTVQLPERTVFLDARFGALGLMDRLTLFLRS